MERSIFGTDGVRGRANVHPMTAEIALRLGQAAGRLFRRGAHRHRVVIGKDTRLSGYMLESALQAGFTSVGMDVLLLGPVPTPAVGLLTRSMRADVGVMVSASHNPYQDNGIKLFGPDGFKLSDAREAEIEALMGGPAALAEPEAIGRARRVEGAAARYVEAVKAAFPRALRLDGLRIVVDCAHGAAYRVARDVLWELGAEVIAIGVEPDGLNINAAVGATDPEACRRAVREHRADLGISLDGDADRVHLIDEAGGLLDGDQLLGTIATRWARAGRLTGGAVVATVMSNLGLERRLAVDGLALLRTRVGDRYVVERMRETGCNVGGEQSGHVILTDFATTGDGLIAALQALEAMVESEAPASRALRSFDPYPQVLRNVRCADAAAALCDARFVDTAAAVERRLGDRGRLVVRASGTEPLLRIMVEAEDETLIHEAIATMDAAIPRP